MRLPRCNRSAPSASIASPPLEASNPDHVGAHVGQHHPRVRARSDAAEFDHPHPGQRSRIAHVTTLPITGGGNMSLLVTALVKSHTLGTSVSQSMTAPNRRRNRRRRPWRSMPFLRSLGTRRSRFCGMCGSQLLAAAGVATYKQVTVLFADVVRSMDIAAAVGVERLRDIVTELVERAAAVVRRYGGTVMYTGDGVMALFGAPTALEDHAFRGCLATLAIQDEQPVGGRG